MFATYHIKQILQSNDFFLITREIRSHFSTIFFPFLNKIKKNFLLASHVLFFIVKSHFAEELSV